MQERTSVTDKEEFQLIQKLFKKRKTERDMNREEIILPQSRDRSLKISQKEIKQQTLLTKLKRTVSVSRKLTDNSQEIDISMTINDTLSAIQ